MKKNVFEMVVALVNGREVADMATLREEINAEYAKMQGKAQEKASIYDAAKPVVLDALRNATAPMTVKEIFEACEADLPDEFSTNKINYALRNYWTDEVVKDTSGKVNTYTAK